MKKFLNLVSFACLLIGGMLMVYSVLGRFIDEPSLMGTFVEDGISAGSVMIGANTFLLLAILAKVLRKDS